MDSRYMSKNFMKEFIEVYRQHPALWKIKSKEYLNKKLKKVAIKALIDVCNYFYVEADKKFVIKKIQSLRGCFRKELRKVQESQRSGASAEDVYVPNLWYYDLLMFTTGEEISSESVSNLESPDPDMYETDSQETQDAQVETICKTDNETESNNITPYEIPTMIETSRPKRRREEETTAEFMKACTAALGSITSSIGEFEAVGINVAAKLSKMTSIQQVYAEYLIQKVLIMGALGKLTEETDVADNVPQNKF